jgi:hypothetical protein
VDADVAVELAPRSAWTSAKRVHRAIGAARQVAGTVETEDEPRVRVPLLELAGVGVAFSVLSCAFDEFAPASG